MSKFPIAVIALAGTLVTPCALAGFNNLVFVPRSAPTLGEVGLGLLVVILGAVGGYLARRKK